MADVALPVALVGVGALYAATVHHSAAEAERPVHFAPIAAFLAGVSVLAIALVSPLDGAAERLLSWHMVQHLLLLSVAAPLLALGRPTLVLVSLVHRRTPSRPNADGRFWVTLLAAAGALVTLLGWHIPIMYESALHDEAVHAAEHFSLVATATLFWEALYCHRRNGTGVLWLFLVTLPTTALGFAMTMARSPWYSTYATRSTPAALADQQLAGVLMWSVGGLAALLGAVALFAVWLTGANSNTTVRAERALS